MKSVNTKSAVTQLQDPKEESLGLPQKIFYKPDAFFVKEQRMHDINTCPFCCTGGGLETDGGGTIGAGDDASLASLRVILAAYCDKIHLSSEPSLLILSTQTTEQYVYIK